jgi:hypothetical protein
MWGLSPIPRSTIFTKALLEIVYVVPCVTCKPSTRRIHQALHADAKYELCGEWAGLTDEDADLLKVMMRFLAEGRSRRCVNCSSCRKVDALVHLIN